MKVKELSKKEKVALLERLRGVLDGLDLSKFKKLEVKEFIFDGYVLYKVGDSTLFFKVKERLVPVLVERYNSSIFSKLASVLVDRGAIPHIANGADVMRPGITRFEGSFNKGDLVIVRDENYRKPIAVGEALEGSEESLKMRKGKVIKNLHYVGDKVWRFASSYLA